MPSEKPEIVVVVAEPVFLRRKVPLLRFSSRLQLGLVVVVVEPELEGDVDFEFKSTVVVMILVASSLSPTYFLGRCGGCPKSHETVQKASASIG